VIYLQAKIVWAGLLHSSVRTESPRNLQDPIVYNRNLISTVTIQEKLIGIATILSVPRRPVRSWCGLWVGSPVSPAMVLTSLGEFGINYEWPLMPSGAQTTPWSGG